MRDEGEGAAQEVLSSSDYSTFKNRLVSSACSRCALSTGRTHIVVDRGNPSAKALFIGEAPGRNEDIQGKAFVGRSGKLLDSLLSEAGFETERDGLIINVVKCRPPKNRAPLPEEILACSEFLKKQIHLVDPKIMVFLGAVSLKHMLPEKRDSAMSGVVGRVFLDRSYPGIPMIALYHPAYILRDPRKRPLMKEHIAHFVETWKKLT